MKPEQTLSTLFKINTPRIAHETLDGETIIIDFDNGAYFSITDIGAFIWEQLAKSASAQDIIEVLKQRYVDEAVDLETEVSQFLAELQQETLISSLDNTASPFDVALAIAELNAIERLPYQTPKLHKYTDMQELLLLDPIHEVDEQGWPMKKV